MRLYFDAAYVAKYYINETDSDLVRDLAESATGLYTSSWSIAEFACVLHRKVREKALTTAQANKLRGFFLEDIRSGGWILLPVSEQVLYRVDTFASTIPPDIYIRSGDALHIITARSAGFTELWTNDRHLLKAASLAGIEGRACDPS